MSSISHQYHKVPTGLSSMFGDHGRLVQRRNYDMCMVFKYKVSKDVQFEPEQQGEDEIRPARAATQSEIDKMKVWKERRQSILKSLQNCGLHVYCYYSRERDEILCKIGASAQKLKDTAARMKYKLQLKSEFLGAYAEYRHDFQGRPELNFSDRRQVSHIYKTHNDSDQIPRDDAIFTTLDKMFILNHIITSKDKECAAIPVPTMLHNEELKAYFPLHEQKQLNELRMSWTNPKKAFAWIWMDREQADKVRNYFGDRIAYYFLWSSFYWKWMAPIAAIGLFLQFVDVLAHTPDNPTAIPFCILLAVWTTFLPHFWRRQEAKYAISWGSLDMVETLQPPRPEHEGEPRINPVTAQVENYYPWQDRARQYVKSTTVVLFSGCLTVAIMLSLVIFKHTHKAEMAMGNVATQFIIATVVELLNVLLSWVARKLTTRENHRTAVEHERAMLTKVVLFKYVNSYFVLYYLAFFKNHAELLGHEMHCFRDDCFLDLQSQLAIFVIWRIVIRGIWQLVAPRVLLFVRTWRTRREHLGQLCGHGRVEMADMTNAEKEANKMAYDSFSDFDETLITHGYATLFAVTSPWVCCAALFGTMFEIVIDARRLTQECQRAMPQKSKTNEPWSTAFDVFGVLGAFTNVTLLIWGSDQYLEWTATEKLCLFVFLEHLVFVARLLVRYAFPEVPNNVELLHLKQENMAHRCLENIKVEASSDFSMFRDYTRDQIEIFENDLMEEESDYLVADVPLDESAKTLYKGTREMCWPLTMLPKIEH